MSGKWIQIPKELIDNPKILEEFFKEWKVFANDPEAPAPYYAEFYNQLAYPDMIGYTTWHEVDNPSFANGSVQELVHFWESMKREAALRAQTCRSYFDGYSGYVADEHQYTSAITAENIAYINGTHPRQGGPNGG